MVLYPPKGGQVCLVWLDVLVGFEELPGLGWLLFSFKLFIWMNFIS